MATVQAKVAGGAGETTVKNLEVKHEGTQIILPVINGTPMGWDEAITWMQRKKKDDETAVNVYQEIHFNPMDAAVALTKAIAKVFGFSSPEPTPGFWGDTPPMFIKVRTGPKDSDFVQVPWGRIGVPGLSGGGFLQTHIETRPIPKFVIGGTVLKKDMPLVEQIVRETQNILRTDSIYKGKAIRVSFEWMREEEDYNPLTHCPEFFDLTGVDENDLILSQEVQEKLANGLFTPIEATEALRKIRVPLKRGVLLAGKYGCGKTLVSAVTALKANRNGWTYFYGKTAEDLEPLYRMATQYGGGVIFIEDVDQQLKGDRSEAMNTILNVLDGVDTKGCEIITVLTTNHPEMISQAAIRPGRIDSYVVIGPPDADATARLINKYARGLLREGSDVSEAAEYLSSRESIPAFVREVVETAKIAAITRQFSAGVPVNEIDVQDKVLAEDIMSAAKSKQDHADLLKPRDTVVPSKSKVLVEVPAGTVGVNRILEKFANANGN